MPYAPHIIEVRTAPRIDPAPYLAAARKLYPAATVREGGRETHSVSITLDGGHADATSAEQIVVCREIHREVGRATFEVRP